MHRDFLRFTGDVRHHVQSLYGTARWAALNYPSDTTNATAIYYRAALKFLNYLEHLGTHRDATDRLHRRVRDRRR
jgi:hypothetical protein